MGRGMIGFLILLAIFVLSGSQVRSCQPEEEFYVDCQNLEGVLPQIPGGHCHISIFYGAGSVENPTKLSREGDVSVRLEKSAVCTSVVDLGAPIRVYAILVNDEEQGGLDPLRYTQLHYPDSSTVPMHWEVFYNDYPMTQSLAATPDEGVLEDWCAAH